jgi:hypothetical protein
LTVMVDGCSDIISTTVLTTVLLPSSDAGRPRQQLVSPLVCTLSAAPTAPPPAETEPALTTVSVQLASSIPGYDVVSVRVSLRHADLLFSETLGLMDGALLRQCGGFVEISTGIPAGAELVVEHTLRPTASFVLPFSTTPVYVCNRP